MKRKPADEDAPLVAIGRLGNSLHAVKPDRSRRAGQRSACGAGYLCISLALISCATHRRADLGTRGPTTLSMSDPADSFRGPTDHNEQMKWPANNSAIRRSPRLAVVYILVVLVGVICQIAVAAGGPRWLFIPAAVLGLGGLVLLVTLIVRNEPTNRARPQSPR